MSYLLRTIDKTSHRNELFDRLARLQPEQPSLWGKMSSSEMIAHLCDQMRMPFNDQPSGPLPGVPQFPLLWYLALYVVPWPKSVKGPPEAFHSKPGNWLNDVATLKKLVNDFVSAPWDRQWPKHPNWGQLTRRQWGYFCYRHIDHHLKQFGV